MKDKQQKILDEANNQDKIKIKQTMKQQLH